MDQERADYADNDLPPPSRLRRKLYRALVAWLLICSVLAGLVGGIAYLLIPTDYADRARGSPTFAAQWREILDQYPDPETAMSTRPEVMGKRFPNGEWVFGVDRDSHKYRDGGTVVVKDSRGRIRVFFGHVCGGGMVNACAREAKTLDEFYHSAVWSQFQFTEYHFPGERP